MLPPHLIQCALESAPDAMIVTDASGAIRFANRRASTLFDYEEGQLLGSPIEQLLPQRLRGRHAEHRERFARSPQMRPMGAGLELAGRRRDGSEFPVEISLSPVWDGAMLLVAATIRDATDRRRIEAELTAAREAADRANRAKSRFLATASHDLRQPLQALSLLNGTLRRLPAPPQVSEALAHQEQVIVAMTRLVNALLDISKLESGAVAPQIADFSVRPLFEELRREFSALALAKGLELEVQSCSDSVRSDPALVGQILRNLVSNALKYTRRGRVLLRCVHDVTMVRLEVADTGIGIPAEQLPLIFEEFFQVGVAANTARDGYGLGLAIVSRLVRLLGLSLEVDSALGEGSSFRLALPVSAGRAPTPQAVRCAERGTELPRFVRRVLLVEDEVAVREATHMLLRAEGYEVVTAESYDEAVRRASERIDLLVTDYHLGGGKTGLDVVTALRARLGPNLAAILLSGDTSAAVQGLRHDERLRIASKPLDAEKLLSLMRELLAQTDA